MDTRTKRTKSHISRVVDKSWITLFPVFLDYKKKIYLRGMLFVNCREEGVKPMLSIRTIRLERQIPCQYTPANQLYLV